MSEMKPDHKSALPLYAQVESMLAADITGGTLTPGSRLPNEEELIAQYGVSRTTIRQTIQNLIRRGLVEIRRGKGTFVLQPKMTQELSGLSGFVEDMQLLGRHASARVLGKQIVPASETVARQLALSAGTPVVRIQRVRLADKVPLSFDETYLPREIGEKILENPRLWPATAPTPALPMLPAAQPARRATVDSRPVDDGLADLTFSATGGHFLGCGMVARSGV